MGTRDHLIQGIGRLSTLIPTGLLEPTSLDTDARLHLRPEMSDPLVPGAIPDSLQTQLLGSSLLPSLGSLVWLPGDAISHNASSCPLQPVSASPEQLYVLACALLAGSSRAHTRSETWPRPRSLGGSLFFPSFNTSQKHNLITGPHAGSLEK